MNSKQVTESAVNKTINMAGEWQCRLDDDDHGIAQAWLEQVIEQYPVMLPGTTQTNRIGSRARKHLISDLTPEFEVVPVVWYQRTFSLTKDESAMHLQLVMERCGWVSSVWLNGVALGRQDSLVAPHRYDLSAAARPGENRLTIRVDISNRRKNQVVAQKDGSEHEDLVMIADSGKRLNCGGHHVSFGGPGWNGITGRIEIELRDPVRISDLQVYPDIGNRQARVKLACINDTQVSLDASLRLTILTADTRASLSEKHGELVIAPGESQHEQSLVFEGAMPLWDEFSPALCVLEAHLKTDLGDDCSQVTFGMRELSQVGTQLAINGRPTFLRGALECFVHPETGFPPTDVAYWLELFGVNKNHGLNHARFHTCCPPEAAFVAADRLGILLNVELPGCSGGEPDDLVTLAYLDAEALRILQTFGNHPSFCMLTMGNELLENADECKAMQKWLMARVARCREEDPRHWYCCTAQPHTEGRDDDFYVSSWPKGASWEHEGEPLCGIRWSGFCVVDSSRFNTRPPETASDYRKGIAGIDKPVITHEVGQWAVYPDIREINDYTGVMKPCNLEIIRDFMAEKGTLEMADDFVRASGELSLLLYKEEIESAMRTPGLGGFQLLGFHDHPPQGTSTIGIVTALRRSKGIVTAEQFRQFCSPTVPLARLEQRTFTSQDSLIADVEIAHYGLSPLSEVTFAWQLATLDGTIIADGVFTPKTFPTGGLCRLGRIEVSLAAVKTAAKATLTVSGSDTEITNSWDVWIYPQPTGISGAEWCREWNQDAADAVTVGATAILELPAIQIPHATRGCLTPVFWNPIMKRNQKCFTMGVLCDPAHPALALFPTEFHSNWQWWDVFRPSRVLDLSALGSKVRPIVRMIDSFIGNRNLGAVFEVRMGKGRLLVTSLDLSSDLETRHAARQLRHSLVSYVDSAAFDPTVECTPDELAELIALHQQEPTKETRDEIKARFDRIPM